MDDYAKAFGFAGEEADQYKESQVRPARWCVRYSTFD